MSVNTFTFQIKWSEFWHPKYARKSSRKRPSENMQEMQQRVIIVG